MRIYATARMKRLVSTLREMSDEIEPELYAVSQLARDEWRLLQDSWPSESQLHAGTTEVTEEQLETIVGKARRFRDIVHGLASTLPSDLRSPALEPLEP